MPEYIAGIEIPEPAHLGTWPLESVDFGTSRRQEPVVAIHQFQAANAKIEQRFTLGAGMGRWSVVAGSLNRDEYEDLRDWFESADGALCTFDAMLPNADGTCSLKRVRFSDWAIAFEHMAGRTVSAGLELIEVPTETPSYTVASTANRFPGSGLQSALLEQDQEIATLVRIIPPGTSDPGDQIWISDRRCLVNGQLYQPRLIERSDLTQSIDGNSDEASITVANADSVFTKLVRSVGLYRARLEISFLHIPTLAKLDWWAGYLVKYPQTWELDFQAGTASFQATDAIAEIGLAYPVSKISQSCWKELADGVHCPYNPGGGIGTGSATACNKNYDDADGCTGRGMERYFGGIRINPQIVHTKDNSTGTFGFGRSALQSSSAIERTVYEQPLPEIWTDIEMSVPVRPIAARDEGDFMSALAVVGRGKIGAYSSNLALHKLDNQPPHDPLRGGGFRGVLGSDPAAESDYFAISQAPWSGASAFPGFTYAAGVAFAEIRRTDEKGLQLSQVLDRTMSVSVYLGRGAWYWNAPGSRAWSNAMTNPFWAVVNMTLEAMGLWVDNDHADGISAAEMEAVFDVEAAIASAAVADTGVPPLIGAEVSERQFIMRGSMRERKPLRDWIGEVLRPALGYATMRFGKLRLGVRTNATAVEAFGTGNVLMDGVSMRGYTPQFNHYSVAFGDEEFGFAEAPPMQYRDEGHAKRIGRSGVAEYIQRESSYFGATRKSQVARSATTFAREELGGITEAEQRNHMEFTLRTTILAANVEAGMVVSYVGPQTDGETIKGRVLQMVLRSDFSLDLVCRTVTDSMYQYITGPKATQAITAPPPAETFDAEAGARYCAGTVQAHASDPIFGALDRFVPVRQEYLQGATEIEPRIGVDLRLPVTQFAAGVRAAEIRTAELLPGGSLPGEKVYYARVAPYNADGELGPPSPAVILRAETDYWDIELSNINWPSGTWAGFVLYVGDSAKGICEQQRTAGSLPSSITFIGPLQVNTNTLPSKTYRKARVKAKGVRHGGVNGGRIIEVTAPNRFRISDFADTTEPIDDWVGEVISVPSDRSDGSAPVWNFEITAFDASTGEFTVTPDCVVTGEPENSVEAEDVGIILARATAATANTITCAKFVNQSAPSGLNVDEEINLLVRLIAGKGRGQVRRVVANTNDTYTIAPDWDETPDITTYFIVEEADWSAQIDTSIIANSVDSVDAIATVTMPLPNLLNRLVLVGAFLVDRDGFETGEELCSIRQIYFYGQPQSVRTITNDSEVTVFDETIWMDTSAGDVTLTLLAESLRRGRQLTVGSISDTGTATIEAAAGEDIDGLDFVTLANREVRIFRTQNQ